MRKQIDTAFIRSSYEYIADAANKLISEGFEVQYIKEGIHSSEAFTLFAIKYEEEEV